MNTKVFISSTCYDLIDLRAELYTFLKESGITPVMSDQSDSHFATYADVNSIETCLVNLRSCDTVVVILSQRYGPTLEKAGYPSVSATHLEYLEALKHGKRIIMFVRDRLEADLNTYRKTGTNDSLVWVNRKDSQIFDIINKHKELADKNSNNWYWTFKNSLDLKRRLQIDLEKSIASIRLDEIIRSGNLPFVTIIPTVDFRAKGNGIKIKLVPRNMGVQPAIEPQMIVYATDDYKKVLMHDETPEEIEDELEVQYFDLDHLESMQKGEAEEAIYDFGEQRNSTGKHYFMAEVIYMTQQGDFLGDITIIEVEIFDREKRNLEFSYNFWGKRYMSEEKYKRIATR